MTTSTERLPNYIDGAWTPSNASESVEVLNPATQEIIGSVPVSPATEVDLAAASAARALPDWQRTPSVERVQHLFKLKGLLEEHIDEIARTITLECGKTFGEARAEMQRAIENVDNACGIPTLMQGDFTEDIARGIDEIMIRQPVGVCACICPFNFPGMIPFWFLPYALACGNTYIVKPSERVPMTMNFVFKLIHQAGFPKGVVNLVHGGRDTVEAILDHPTIRAISFVGSTPVAKAVYARAAAQGKRAQCQGGAKNPVVILPDADAEMTTRILADSAFGCAGQRCLAASLAITVGDDKSVREAILDTASSRKVGFGLDEGVEMGPVITAQSKERITGLVGKAADSGAKVAVDGRSRKVEGFEAGNFVFPTVLDGLTPESDAARTEIFGPVLGLMHADSVDDAITAINASPYGNMACLFTSDGRAARKFRSEVQAGNIGINVGVAAPMASFPFSGWKESFFGDLHGQARHAVEFFTQTKVVVERWPREWSRKF